MNSGRRPVMPGFQRLLPSSGAAAAARPPSFPDPAAPIGNALPLGPTRDAAGLSAAPSATTTNKGQRRLSPVTEKIYGDHWGVFRAWCQDRGIPSLPACPARVADYLAERSATLGRSGLRLILAAIAHHHRRANQPWSTAHPAIAAAMQGPARGPAQPVRPAAPLTTVELRSMLAGFGDDLAAMRDRALLLVGFAAALRRAALVALDREDVRFTAAGMVLRIRPALSDSAGDGVEISIARGDHAQRCAVRALEAWLQRAAIEYGAVFRRLTAAGTIEGRLTGNGVWKILRRRAATAGLAVGAGVRLSPDSLRAGSLAETGQAIAPKPVPSKQSVQGRRTTARRGRRRTRTAGPRTPTDP